VGDGYKRQQRDHDGDEDYAEGYGAQMLNR